MSDYRGLIEEMERDRAKPATVTTEPATDETSLCMIGKNGYDPYDLNVREMIRGNPVRLRYTRRYSTCRVNNDENVAEHSYYVMFYAAMIGQWLQRHPQSCGDTTGDPWQLAHRLNWELLMVRAAIHDLEESRTGDMPRTFKYSTPALTTVHATAAAEAFKQIVDKLVSPGWADRLLQNWMCAKDSRLEGKVIAFADFLSVLSFITQEWESGNRNAVEHIEEMTRYFENFRSSEFAAIAPLVDAVEPLLKEVI